ncbi:MAG: septation protein IspZ [Paracoccaceae bacterium]
MAEKKIKGWLKAVLEFGPIVAFLAGFVLTRGMVFHVGGTEYPAFIAVTALFIPLIVISTGALWALTGTISQLQIFTVVMVVGMGGLSVWLKDERFFKMKPTALYLLFAAILGYGLSRGKSLLSSVLGAALPLEEAGWMILTKRITLFFLGLAVANEIIWRNFETETWVIFKFVGLPLSLVAFFMTQGKVLEKYEIKKTEDEA